MLEDYLEYEDKYHKLYTLPKGDLEIITKDHIDCEVDEEGNPINVAYFRYSWDPNTRYKIKFDTYEELYNKGVL